MCSWVRLFRRRTGIGGVTIRRCHYSAMQPLRVTSAVAALGLAMVSAPTAVAIPGYQSCPSPPGYQTEVQGPDL